MQVQTNILRVPIRADALYVGQGGQRMTLPMADFSRLPYNLSNGSTVNTQPPTPNLAEAALNPLLGRADASLGPLPIPPGVHLHWALPDALTVGHNRGGSTRFPAVPNRWLVRRLDGAGSPQKAWVVESDYLHPVSQTGMPGHLPPPVDESGRPVTAWPGDRPITFPTKRLQLHNGKPGAAFRYMGRAVPLKDWLAGDETGGEYLNQPGHSEYPLTAIGYGEPTFAAYYPNCYSVFGFCDVDGSLNPDGSYEYQIIGWYNEPALDPLQSPDLAEITGDAGRYDALENEYGWVVDEAGRRQEFPQRTVCYASLVLTPHKVAPWTSGGRVTVSIANTGGEALAALLAESVADGQAALKRQIEDQLEAMNLAPALQGVQVDYQAHFARVRHERSFVGVGGGSRWAVLPKRVQPDSADADDASQPPLPEAVARALDRLNTAQEAYDAAWQEITELRYQTFCDWHKFLSAFYSDPAGWLQPFRENSDSMVDYIENVDLTLLNAKLTRAGVLTAEGPHLQAQGSTTATLDLSTNTLTPSAPANSTLAVQVLLRLEALLDALRAAELTDQFEVVSRSADSFWRPREPVVLLSGDVAVSTPRHGEDGDLPCGVLRVGDVPGSETFVGAAATLKPGAGDPALQTQAASPWHPILLEWSASLAAVRAGRRADPAIHDTLGYDPTFVTGSFALQENVPDLSTTGSLPVGGPDTYSGRCVITPMAGTRLNESLSNYLCRTTLYEVRDPAADSEAGYLDRLIAWFRLKHAVSPPDEDRVAWSKSQRPFVDTSGALLAVADLLAWYTQKPVAGANNTVANLGPAQKAADPVFSAIRALSNLEGSNVLSQALGGFNAGLMVREQMLQIPIEDPLGADQLQTVQQVTTDVARAVGAEHPFAPLSSKVFNPIRSGRFTLSGLRMIDTFGQQWNASLADAPFVISNGLSDPNQAGAVFLPPRYAAPLRLDFRWLAGGSGEVETGDEPATTPIVGWLVPDNLESSLMVYDAAGGALGSINALAEWNPAPASDERISAAEIPDPYLRRLVRRLVVDVGTPSDEVVIRQHFMQSLISTVDSALEAIEPASFAQHEALALLMARPIAVVRTRVDLQLMGQPLEVRPVADPTIVGGHEITVEKSARWKSFADQNWDVFAYDWGQFYGCTYDEVINGSCSFLNDSPTLDRYVRSTRGFQNVVVPLRIGEHQLLNDGVVGFWTETPEGDLDNVFHAPQTLEGLEISPDVTYRPGITTPAIRAYAEGQTDNLNLTVQDDPLSLTLLVDPRAVVHATCGVLPVRALEIPPAYYADALRRMGVAFRFGPLLTDSEQLHAAVPKEPGYVWSWVTKPNGSTWEETTDIAEATEQAQFFKPPVLVDGWLKLTPSDTNAPGD